MLTSGINDLAKIALLTLAPVKILVVLTSMIFKLILLTYNSVIYGTLTKVSRVFYAYLQGQVKQYPPMNDG